jgi:hypothetical protein
MSVKRLGDVQFKRNSGVEVVEWWKPFKSLLMQALRDTEGKCNKVLVGKRARPTRGCSCLGAPFLPESLSSLQLWLTPTNTIE